VIVKKRMKPDVLSRYYSHVQPVSLFLKEEFQGEKVEQALAKNDCVQIDRSPTLDGIFINEAQTFLQLVRHNCRLKILCVSWAAGTRGG
jgi:hypothetical protein